MLKKDGEKMVSEDVRVNTRPIFGEDFAKPHESSELLFSVLIQYIGYSTYRYFPISLSNTSG